MSNHEVEINVNNPIKLPWFTPKDSDEIMVYFAPPIQIVVKLIDIPLVSVAVLYGGETVIISTYRVNPGDAIETQKYHSLVIAEHIVSTMFDIFWYHDMYHVLFHEIPPTFGSISDFNIMLQEVSESLYRFVETTKDGDENATER